MSFGRVAVFKFASAIPACLQLPEDDLEGERSGGKGERVGDYTVESKTSSTTSFFIARNHRVRPVD